MAARMIRSKVAGVTFRNADGSSRQTIIRKFCRNGKSLEVRLEPDNPYSENAIGLWVSANSSSSFPAQYQIGYVKHELANRLRELIDEGWEISVRILQVTGGEWFPKRNYGLNIEICLESGKGASNQRKRQPRPRQGTPAPAAPIQPLSLSPASHSPAPTITASLFSWFGGVAHRTTRHLLNLCLELWKSHKIIFVGSFSSIGGVALWTLGYLFEKSWESFAILRHTGVVTLFVGLGILSVGIVFSLTESQK